MDVHYDVAKMQTTVPRVARQAHDHHHQYHHYHQINDAHKNNAKDTMHEDHHDHSMLMTFHFGSTETILFEFCKTNGALGMTVACLIVFFIAFLYEGLKFYRGRLFNCHRRRLEAGGNRSNSRASTSTIGRRKTNVIQLFEPKIPVPLAETMAMAPTGEPTPTEHKRRKYPWLSWSHLFQTFLHMLQVIISFMLMLIFMTCNVWICIAIVLGAGFGYFIFYVRFENVTDHCN